MAFVTLEIGPTWRMQVLCGLLEARGLPAVVHDDSLKVYLGDAPSNSSLLVPEEYLGPARAAVDEAQRDGDRALEPLRFARNPRYPGAPSRVRGMLLDVAFWLALFLVGIVVVTSLFL